MSDASAPHDEASYLQLLQTLDTWFARGSAAAGPGVVPCARGCTACCFGPFDVSAADAELVADAVAALPDARRAPLLQRAAAQRVRYAEFLPAWRAPWDIETVDETAFDALSEALADESCPALDDDGACVIHASRPATCRIMGLGMLLPDGDVLDNACPIRATFPAYDALGPTPFDLLRFEHAAALHDAAAEARGWLGTTIAGAVASIMA